MLRDSSPGLWIYTRGIQTPKSAGISIPGPKDILGDGISEVRLCIVSGNCRTLRSHRSTAPRLIIPMGLLTLRLFRKASFSTLDSLLTRRKVRREVNQPLRELPVQPCNAFVFRSIRVLKLPLHDLCKSPAGPRSRLYRSRRHCLQIFPLSINSGLVSLVRGNCEYRKDRFFIPYAHEIEFLNM